MRMLPFAYWKTTIFAKLYLGRGVGQRLAPEGRAGNQKVEEKMVRDTGGIKVGGKTNNFGENFARRRFYGKIVINLEAL